MLVRIGSDVGNTNSQFIFNGFTFPIIKPTPGSCVRAGCPVCVRPGTKIFSRAAWQRAARGRIRRTKCRGVAVQRRDNHAEISGDSAENLGRRFPRPGNPPGHCAAARSIRRGSLRSGFGRSAALRVKRASDSRCRIKAKHLSFNRFAPESQTWRQASPGSAPRLGRAKSQSGRIRGTETRSLEWPPIR
jgi:hypothetical protein